MLCDVCRAWVWQKYSGHKRKNEGNQSNKITVFFSEFLELLENVYEWPFFLDYLGKVVKRAIITQARALMGVITALTMLPIKQPIK